MTNEKDHSTEYDDFGSPRLHHPPTIDDIQLEAMRLHYRHGGIFGGYSLEDWLEAEHELSDDVDSSSPGSPDGC
jgi:hypothetical protein